MNQKWKKVVLITGPLLVAGSVYAFAADGGANQAADRQGLVTYAIGESKPLSDAELQALAGAKPAAPASSADSTDERQSALDEEKLAQYDPFEVKEPTVRTAEQRVAEAKLRAEGAFDLSLVKKLELKTHTTLGELTLEFKADGKEAKLEGRLGERKIEVKGERAYELLNRLLANLELDGALTAALQGRTVTLDVTAVGALEKLEVELADGRKIESKGKSPKMEGRHDNGKHLGELKHKEKEKAKKGKGHGHGKKEEGHGKGDQDDDHDVDHDEE